MHTTRHDCGPPPEERPTAVGCCKVDKEVREEVAGIPVQPPPASQIEQAHKCERAEAAQQQAALLQARLPVQARKATHAVLGAASCGRVQGLMLVQQCYYCHMKHTSSRNLIERDIAVDVLIMG